MCKNTNRKGSPFFCLPSRFSLVVEAKIEGRPCLLFNRTRREYQCGTSNPTLTVKWSNLSGHFKILKVIKTQLTGWNVEASESYYGVRECTFFSSSFLNEIQKPRRGLSAKAQKLKILNLKRAEIQKRRNSAEIWRKQKKVSH